MKRLLALMLVLISLSLFAAGCGQGAARRDDFHGASPKGPPPKEEMEKMRKFMDVKPGAMPMPGQAPAAQQK